MLHPVKPTEYPLHVVTCKMALQFKVPLFIHGENIALTLGVTGAREANDDALGCRNNVTVAGGNASDWLHEDITMKDLIWYQYPDDAELRANVRGIHLDYYAKEFSRRNNMEFAIKRGLVGREEDDPAKTGMLNRYTCLDSNMQLLSNMLKYYKFGFGFVTDEVCYDIREGARTRDEAIDLVKKYDGCCAPEYIQEFLDYVEMTEEEFWRVVGIHVNKDLFNFNPSTQKWEPTFEVGKL